MTGAERIAAERQRQIDAEGWTSGHDDSHRHGELARAGACYALPTQYRWAHTSFWPWLQNWWKPTPKDRVRELEKAGALIAAEIDRLLRSRLVAPAEKEPT